MVELDPQLITVLVGFATGFVIHHPRVGFGGVGIHAGVGEGTTAPDPPEELQSVCIFPMLNVKISTPPRLEAPQTRTANDRPLYSWLTARSACTTVFLLDASDTMTS